MSRLCEPVVVMPARAPDTPIQEKSSFPVQRLRFHFAASLGLGPASVAAILEPESTRWFATIRSRS